MARFCARSSPGQLRRGGEPDIAWVVRRGTYLRNRRRVTVAVASVIVVAGVASVAAGWLGISGKSEGIATSQSPSNSTGAEVRNAKIAFLRVAAGFAGEGRLPDAQIYTADASGRNLSLLIEGASYRSRPEWSPDGAAIAFVGPEGLLVARADGSDITTVVACGGSTCDGTGPPAWAPDGGKLAFWSGRAQGDGLWVVGQDGKGLTLLRADLEVRGAPAWSPDGSEIAVIAAAEKSAERRVVFLDSDSGETTRELRLDGIQPGEGLDWSHDGERLVFDAYPSDGVESKEGIFIVGTDGGGLRLLTSCPGGGCMDLYPTWSPDGKLVAFTRGLCGESGSDCFVGDLYVVDVSQGDVERLTSGASLDCCPAWQGLIP